MHKVQIKLMVGLLFALFAILVQTFIRFYDKDVSVILDYLGSIGINFIIFFLIGYIIIGNLLSPKNTNE